LAEIGGLIDAARSRSGCLLVIEGAAGIGKTALCSAAVERARAAGVRGLAARGGELEAGFSFGVARQLFEPLLAGVSDAEREALVTGAARHAMIALEGTISEAALGGDRSFTAIHGLYWLAVNASLRNPLLVVVDDLQWADEGSVRWLLYLADRLDRLALAPVLSWRVGEGRVSEHHLARLEQSAGTGVLSPAPLSARAVRELLEDSFHDHLDERFVDACHAATGGNPFLVRELAASLRADGIAPDEAAADRLTQLGPRSVARAVSLQIAQLGPAAVDLARAVAIFGRGVELRHAAALAVIPLHEAATAADRLAAIEVLEPGAPLRFVHPLVRTAVHDDIPAAERSLRHAEAARLLAAEDADPDEVCAHLLACEPAGSVEVIERLRAAAARALARGAPDSAAAYLRRALSEKGDRELRVDLLHELGQAEMLLRDPEAIEHLSKALELAQPAPKRLAIACELSELLAYAGQWEGMAAMIAQARAELKAREASEATRATAMRMETLWASYAAYDPRVVAEFDARLERLLASTDERDAATRALAALLAGVLAWRGEHIERVPTLVDHALDKGRFLAEHGPDAMVLPQTLFALIHADALDPADAVIDELLEVSKTRGDAFGLVVGECCRAGIRARRGELPAAEADIRSVLDLAQERALAFLLPSVLYVGVDALIERPELGDVAALAAGLELPADLAQTASGAMVREVRGRLALAEGKPAVAAVELRAAAATYEALHLLNPNGSCWRSALALALAIAGEGRPRALQLVTSELKDARRLRYPRPTGIALRTLGVLEGGERGLGHL
ncbi:MAG TPA: AAA family ATPase, partial [Myxococcota bacterium]|nr:AAA family ATPase [Myxococcota bacterium]